MPASSCTTGLWPTRTCRVRRLRPDRQYRTGRVAYDLVCRRTEQECARATAMCAHHDQIGTIARCGEDDLFVRSTDCGHFAAVAPLADVGRGEGAQSLEDARPVFLADLSRRRIEVLVDDPVLVPVEHMQQGEPLARLLGEKQRVLEGFQGRGREVDGAENR